MLSGFDPSTSASRNRHPNHMANMLLCALFAKAYVAHILSPKESSGAYMTIST